MQEGNIEIETKQVGDRTFKNINIKEIASGSDESFIVVKKVKYNAPYKKDMGSYQMLTFSVKYKDTECTFVSFDESLEEQWENVAGIDDDVKIIHSKEMYVDKKKVDRVKHNIRFEKVQVI